MKAIPYLVYAAAVLAAFAIWAVVIYTMRKSKRGTPLVEARRTLLIGPAHLILRKREYRLTTREVVGWAFVAALMLVAPWLSHWLGKL